MFATLPAGRFGAVVAMGVSLGPVVVASIRFEDAIWRICSTILDNRAFGLGTRCS